MRRICNGIVLAVLFLFISAMLIGGCGGGGQVTSGPSVTFTFPLGGDAGVFLNTKITATFSEAMDPATINTTTFTLNQGVTAVSGTVTYVGVTAVFTPASNLAPNTVYTATVTTGARNPAGDALVANKIWIFTTGTAIDTTAPTVSATVPLRNATVVPLNQKIAATFSKVMDPTTLTTTTFTLTQGGTAVTGTVTYTGVTAVFTPASNLAANTVYTASITTGAIDLTGNALASDYVWNFTTGDAIDSTAPIVTLVDPLDGATGVPLNQTIVATFSKDMDPLTITTATFTLTQGDASVAGDVVYVVVGRTATFTPAVDLLPNTLYTATITIVAADLAGNPLAANEVWSFTTGAGPDITPPTVTLTSPLDGATGVCPGGLTIDATFSELMNPLTITTANFTVSGAPGTLIYFPETRKVVFTPDAPLALDTLYTATITTGVKDLAGNAMAADKVWTFRTSAVACQAPVMGFAAGDILQPYGVLSGLAITLAGADLTGLRVDGDVGISPGSTCDGCTTTQVSGTINVANAPAAAAKVALIAAYDDAVNRATNQCTLVAGGDLSINPPPACGGISDGTFPPGLYWSGTILSIPVNGTITLDAGGDANAVFIFQSESTIGSLANSHVVLANLADAKNVFWVAKSSATIGGTTSDFAGTVIALEDFTVLTGTAMEGRALARNGSVTVQDGALITVPTP
jgi:hypothetical protein